MRLPVILKCGPQDVVREPKAVPAPVRVQGVAFIGVERAAALGNHADFK